MNEETLKERERCKEIVSRKINTLIGWREESIKHKEKRLIYIFNHLRDDILFLIDNPNYVRKGQEGS